MTVLEHPGHATLRARWRDSAACLDHDPDLFYPETPAQLRQARQICRGCHVRADCVRDALRTGDEWGVRGGLVPGEYQPLPPAIDNGSLAAVLAQADEADTPDGDRPIRPLVRDLVHLLAEAATPLPPARPDPEAALHRAILLRELDAYEAASPHRRRIAELNEACQAIRDDRMELYARHRDAGDSIPRAAERIGMTARTGQRYETRLVAAGRATWRKQTEASRAA